MRRVGCLHGNLTHVCTMEQCWVLNRLVWKPGKQPLNSKRNNLTTRLRSSIAWNEVTTTSPLVVTPPQIYDFEETWPSVIHPCQLTNAFKPRKQTCIKHGSRRICLHMTQYHKQQTQPRVNACVPHPIVCACTEEYCIYNLCFTQHISSTGRKRMPFVQAIISAFLLTGLYSHQTKGPMSGIQLKQTHNQ